MTGFALGVGGPLLLRVGDGPWQEVLLAPERFADSAAATAQEIADVLDGVGGVAADVEDGVVVLTSARAGASASVEIDVRRSPVATALGLASAGPFVRATGRGPDPARLVSAPGPFRFAAQAGMTVRVNGRGRRVRFPEGEAVAADIAAAVDAALRRPVAETTADGRVAVVSPRIGPGGTVEVVPGPPGSDAAAVLGFVGANALSDPWRSDPARLRLAPPGPTVTVTNLTGAPVELHLPTGQVVLPARGRLTTSRALADDPAVARLAARAVLRVDGFRVDNSGED